MKKRFGKNDIIFIVVLFLIAIVIWFVGNRMFAKQGSFVQVSIDGELYGTYELDKKQTVDIKINGKTTNILQIEDGRADMISADCPDQLCVHQNSISKENQTIVCLPNKVVVEVIGADKAEYDAVVK